MEGEAGLAVSGCGSKEKRHIIDIAGFCGSRYRKNKGDYSVATVPRGVLT